MNATAAIGAASILTALATALFACGGAALGQRLRHAALIEASRRALIVTALFTTVAICALGVALLRNDFSLAYVAGVSSRAMQTPMKWASLYSQQPGSLLFWTWSMSLLMALFASRTVPRIPWGGAHATAVCGATIAAFLIALAFLASPFHVSAVTPEDGLGLNPLLVDPGMLVHPPALLTGLVSTAIPFALGMAALMAARIDAAWLRAVRSWALLSWLVLSVGNFLGGWWAYTVLGWGGYWGWDPVENSAILPLLPLTAFLHSAMVQERRGMLKLWNVALVVAAFALAVFGTFNVRSGLVDSVHSFAQSEVGAYFLVLLAIVLAAAIALMAWRAPYLRAEHDFESYLSRESALIVNNYLFTAIALVVLGGTLFPVFSELFADGTRVTVGPPFFNRVVGPLLIALVALIAIGTVLPWRRASSTTLVRRARTPLLSVLVALAGLLALGMRDPFALIATVAAIALAVVTAREFVLGARGMRTASGHSWWSSFTALFARDQRRYGGYLVHLGIAVMAVAVVGSTIYQQQLRHTVAPGDSFEAGGRTLTYEGLRERTGLANGVQREIIAPLTVSRDGEDIGRLTPGRRQFTNFPQQPTAIVDLNSTWRDDLYVFVQGWDDEGVAEFHVFVNPLIVWLWIGAAVYVAGGILAWAPLAAPAPELARAPERAPVPGMSR
jgi:cytochrome c-type biogenesis protein CcmF